MEDDLDISNINKSGDKEENTVASDTEMVLI